MLKKNIFATVIFLLFSLQTYVSGQELSAPALVYRVGYKWTAVNETGKSLFTTDVLLDVESYSEGLLGGYAYAKDTSVSSVYYNKSGKIEVISKSSKPYPYHNNHTIILEAKQPLPKRYEYKYGIANRAGNMLLPVQYLDILRFTEGLAYVMGPTERGFIDTTGQFVIKLEDGVVGYGFSEGLSPVSRIDIGKFGYIDKKGNLVIDYKYYEADKFSDGLARVLFPNSQYGIEFFGYINHSGDLIINNLYSEAASFQEGRAFVGGMIDKELRWGVINKDGIHLTEHIFPEYTSFSDSVAVVKNINDSLYYHIDYQAKPLNTNKYKYCGSFKNGKAFVIMPNDKKYFIDKKGNLLFEIPKDADIIFDCRTNEKYSAKKDNAQKQ